MKMNIISILTTVIFFFNASSEAYLFRWKLLARKNKGISSNSFAIFDTEKPLYRQAPKNFNNLSKTKRKCCANVFFQTLESFCRINKLKKLTVHKNIQTKNIFSY